MSQEKVTRETFDRYMATCGLDEHTKNSLRAEFTKTSGARSVLDKAVRLSGRKAMTKVPKIASK